MTIMTMYDDNFDKTICVNINPEDDVMTLMIFYLAQLNEDLIKSQTQLKMDVDKGR